MNIVNNLSNKYDVKFSLTPDGLDAKVFFNDTQFLTFDPDNVDAADLERRIAFWSRICKSREFANVLYTDRNGKVREDYVKTLADSIKKDDDGNYNVYHLNF